MKVYLAPKANLSGLAMTSYPSWEIPTPPASINPFQLRNFILNQAITITNLNQIASENLPYLVVDSPAWVAQIKGQIGEKIPQGLILEQATVQIFSKKVADSSSN